jgi:hypothetical protein
MNEAAAGTAIVMNTNAGSRRRWLAAARLAWLAFFAIATVTLLAALPARWAELTQPTPTTLANLNALGWPVMLYAVYSLATEVIFIGTYLAVGLIIFARRSDDGMALFTSLMLVAFGVGNQTIAPTIGALRPYPFGEFIFAFGGFAAWATFTQFPYLFPGGRYLPAWTRVPALIWFLLCFPWNFMVGSPLDPLTWSPLMAGPLLLALWGSWAVSQVYRYARVSSPIQRQQTKWVVYALALIVAGMFTLSLVSSFYDGAVLPFSYFLSGEATTPQLFSFVLLARSLVRLTFLLLPLAFAFSILRYRLFEIDLIIRRTLVYVPLTAILAGLFAASISITQKLFVTLTGQQSDAATVMTTLIVVAAFEPIKAWLQRIVDRRFKEAPDPTKTLNAFGDQVQAVVQVLDPTQLAKRLLDEAVRAFDATGGAVTVEHNSTHLTYQVGELDGIARLCVPLHDDAADFGALELGARKNGEAYSDADRQVLTRNAARVARALALAAKGKE